MEITFPYEIDWLPGDISTEFDKLRFGYNGKEQQPKCTLKFRNRTLVEGMDYFVVSPGAVVPGIYELEFYAFGRYRYGMCSMVQFEITKGANPMKVSPRTASVKYSRLKKKSQMIERKKIVSVSSDTVGDVRYKKVSGNKKIAVSSSGRATVKKGLKKGTYSVKIKVTAAGNDHYNSKTKTVTSKIKVS